MSFFSEVLNIRLAKEELEDIDKIIKKKKFLYENRYHFLRCAVIKLIRDHKV